MAQTVDIRGLHLHGAHHHAGGAKSPRRSRSPVAEDDTATAQNSPSLNATQSEDTVSVDSRDLEQVDRELAAAVVAGLTTKAVEVEIDGEKVTISIDD